MSVTDTGPLSEEEDRAPADDEQDEKRKPFWRELPVLVVIAFAAALLIKTFLLQAFYIPSLSMAPTLKVNDRVLVNKLSYDLHDVHRGDLVVFENPGDEGTTTKDLIKRVVGLPGETVEARDGKVLINGQILDEPYLQRDIETRGAICHTETKPGCQGPDKIVVPEDQYFVMGDNRANSRDSRFIGAIPGDRIIGRAFIRVWPITEIGLL